jgi:transposase
MEKGGKLPSLTPEERSRPRVEALEAWLREQYDRLSPNNQVAKSIRLQPQPLGRPCPLPRRRATLPQNAAERALRGVAVGRHNWTFAGSDAGGQRAAAVYTLIETAKLNDIDPQAWLADVLARLPDHPAKRIPNSCPGTGSCGTRTGPPRRRQITLSRTVAVTGRVRP